MTDNPREPAPPSGEDVSVTLGNAPSGLGRFVNRVIGLALLCGLEFKLMDWGVTVPWLAFVFLGGLVAIGAAFPSPAGGKGASSLATTFLSLLPLLVLAAILFFVLFALAFPH